MSLHYVKSNPEATARPLDVLTVLIHGGAVSSNMFRTLTPHLTTPSVSPDLPGHGESVHLGPFTFAKSSELLHALLTSFKSDPEFQDHKILVVGISLGGQAVLDLLSKHPSDVSAAIVSGASIHPPDDRAGWELPHMPSDQQWLDILMADVQKMGMENAQAVQNESFTFTFDVTQNSNALNSFPPVLICVGEEDTPMSRRDFDELTQMVKRANQKSESVVLKDAWHNHPIDVPEAFAELINDWTQRMLSI